VGTECVVCEERDAEFRFPPLCALCRQTLAAIVLNATGELVAELWRIDQHFEERRSFLLASVGAAVVGQEAQASGVAPDEGVAAARASVAQGLLELGHMNDPLILAAIAVLNGRSSDHNKVAASALAVFFDERIARAAMLPGVRKLIASGK